MKTILLLFTLAFSASAFAADHNATCHTAGTVVLQQPTNNVFCEMSSQIAWDVTYDPFSNQLKVVYAINRRIVRTWYWDIEEDWEYPTMCRRRRCFDLTTGERFGTLLDVSLDGTVRQ
jgi:hypothetical protein